MDAVVAVRDPVRFSIRPPRRWWVAASLALVGAAAAGVLIGPAGLPTRSVLLELASRLPLVHVHSGLSATDKAIVWQIRMPRMVLGGLVGWTLAASGAGYQGVFRNPLADPYLLGAAAGAGLGATLVIAYAPGSSGWPVDPVPAAAFVGAMAAVTVSYLVATAADRRAGTATIVLAGVAVAAFFTAVQTYVQQQHASSLHDVYTWILGRLTTSGWHDVWLVLPYVVVSSAVLLAHRRVLDVLSVGEAEASTLGVDTARARLLVVGAATLGTAAVVAVSGLIGFVGIIVPHFVRLSAGGSYRRVLPLSMVGGAAFLILADLIARTVVSPGEVPIGVVTAFFGAPFFVLVLRRRAARA
ncbi:MAG TPA: iron ABC transporter permease [Acidimicrobiales bacterium]|nr:iron ABC transporter permease [Acidimicrobiales bacterium]